MSDNIIAKLVKARAIMNPFQMSDGKPNMHKYMWMLVQIFMGQTAFMPKWWTDIRMDFGDPWFTLSENLRVLEKSTDAEAVRHSFERHLINCFSDARDASKPLRGVGGKDVQVHSNLILFVIRLQKSLQIVDDD